MDELTNELKKIIQNLFGMGVEVVLTRPEEQFGDFSTNVAMQIAKKSGNNPREVAQAIVDKITEQNIDSIQEITIAGPGFINIKLSDKALIKLLSCEITQSYKGKEVVAEYSDPNPFKVLHAGHVYTTVVGDSVANLLEVAGGKVHRVNFGGDVGMHVAKTMWVILKKLGTNAGESALDSIPESERSAWLAEAYVEGNNLFESDEVAKKEMTIINKQIYQLHNTDDHESDLARIYWKCREWSYQAFDAFYERLGTNMEKYYPESEVADLGFATVKEQLSKGVFKESDGAVIFPGEDYGLHTRVFINSEGIPTYEAKDVGVVLQKYQDYHFDYSVIVTDNEQQQYMAVVLKAIEQFEPSLAKATTYIPHGKLKMVGGVKMSSRLGNIIRADEVIKVTSETLKASGREPENSVVLAAVKYAFLKYRIGGDVIYDPEESVSLQGNSGPYLQYAHARARSILSKSKTNDVELVEFEPDERTLVRKIGEYSEVVDKAVDEFMPHLICTYLYELAQVFNRFYENNRVIGDKREDIRAKLVGLYAKRLKEGLELLGIVAPESM